MEVIYGLVGVTVLLVIGIAALLLWAVRSGQFDDMEGPAWRVLMDDDGPEQPEQPEQAAREQADDERQHEALDASRSGNENENENGRVGGRDDGR